MKTSTLISMCAISALVLVSAPISARPMHAGIDYKRYLAEKEVTHVEWRNWLAKHGSDAEKRGLMPTSEDRSMDDFEEDARQRIFMSKNDVAKAQAANPDANFSIDVVYSILTKDEFASKILNSYAKGNGTITRLPSRSLRTQYDFTSNAKMLNKLTSLRRKAAATPSVLGTA